MEEVNYKMITFEVMKKTLLLCSECLGAERDCHFQGKRKCCNDEDMNCEPGQVQWKGGFQREGTHPAWLEASIIVKRN